MNSAQDQANAAGALAGMMGLGMILFVVVFWLAVMAFLIWLFYRIFTKAGMSGGLAFLLLIPGLGPLIAICILAFGEWKVIPAPQTYGGLPPTYPPPSYPPSYPPAS